MTSLSVRPFLMFQGDAAAALDLYTRLFPDSTLDEVEHYGADEPGELGTIKRARFTIAGQSVLCTDSVVPHTFSFTPSFSFFVECSSEAELMRLYEALRAGGSEMIPADNHGFSKLFAWINDRFGVSWQLNLA